MKTNQIKQELVISLSFPGKSNYCLPIVFLLSRIISVIENETNMICFGLLSRFTCGDTEVLTRKSRRED